MKKLSLLLFFFLVSMVSCIGTRGDILHEVLSHKELAAASLMIGEYDNFISLHLRQPDVPVEQAYATFLQLNAPFAKTALDGDNFMPSPLRIVEVFDEIGPSRVKKFLVFDENCEMLRISRDGKYLDILEKLASQKEIYARMLENAKVSSGPAIDGDWLVVDEYQSIDFSQPAERLVFMLNVFSFPGVSIPL